MESITQKVEEEMLTAFSAIDEISTETLRTVDFFASDTRKSIDSSITDAEKFIDSSIEYIDSSVDSLTQNSEVEVGNSKNDGYNSISWSSCCKEDLEYRMSYSLKY